MKKIFTLFLLAILSIKVDAQSSQLTFVSEEGDKFWVVIDGEKINKEPAFRVEARVGQFGYGAIKNSYVVNIIFENEEFKDIRRVIKTNHIKNYTYLISRSRNVMRMRRISGGYNMMPF